MSNLANQFRLLSLILVLLMLFVGMTGCNIFRGSSSDDESKEKIVLNYTEEVSIQTLWTKRIGKGLGKKFVEIQPAIVADLVLVADAYGTLVALNRFNGDEVWRTQVGRPDARNFFDFTNRSDPSFVSGGVSVGRGKVFVGTVRGYLIALALKDGSEVWRKLLSGEVLAPAAVADDVVVVQTGDGKMYALELEDGETRWIFSTQNPVLSLRGTGTPAIDNGQAVAGFANGLVAAVDLTTGAPAWEQRVTLPEGTTELERIVDVDGTPLVLPRLVYAASHQGRVRAMIRESGDIFWEASEPSHRAVAAGFDSVYVVRDDDEIVALQQDNGNEIWRQGSLIDRALTDPLTYSNYLLVGDESGTVHVLAQTDGRLLTSTKVGASVQSPLIVEDGVVYLLNTHGQLRALRISGAE